MTTGISWADETWNPFVGCKPVSPACVNCYAQDMAARVVMMEAGRGRLSHYAAAVRQTPKGPVWTGHIARAGLDARFAPFKWAKSRDIFPGSMTDFFHPGAPDEWRIEAFAVMALTPRHHYLPLTKRSAEMRRFMSAPATEKAIWQKAAALAIERDLCLTKIEDMQPGAWPLPNVALGVTAEDQTRADERIPDLLATPAAKRFVSCEPLLGAVDPTRICLAPKVKGSARAGIHLDALRGRYCESGQPYIGDWDVNGPYPVGAPVRHLDWIIAGGESGAQARPSHPDWFRSLRDQCAAAGVPFHFKQWGEWAPHKPQAGGDLGGALRKGLVDVVHPSGRSHVEIAEATGGRNSEPGTRYMIRLGTHRAGFRLDGVEYRARLLWSA